MAKKKSNAASSRTREQAHTQETPGQSVPAQPPAAPADNQNLPFRKGFFRDWFEVLMYGVSLLIFLNTYVFQNLTVPTESMENTILIGDHVTVNKMIYAKTQWDWERRIFPVRDVRRGDVVVFKFPGRAMMPGNDERFDYVKRCVAVPGDRVRIQGDQLYINGLPVEEPYPVFKWRVAMDDRDPQNTCYPYDWDSLKPGLLYGEQTGLHDYFQAPYLVYSTVRSMESYRQQSGDHFKAVFEPLKQAWAADLAAPMRSEEAIRQASGELFSGAGGDAWQNAARVDRARMVNLLGYQLSMDFQARLMHRFSGKLAEEGNAAYQAWLQNNRQYQVYRSFVESPLVTADQEEEVLIPEGYYLMLGDNRNNSADGRRWGLVPRTFILGRPHWIWWSYGEQEGTADLAGKDLIWNYARVVFRFFTHTHWERCFQRIR